MVFHYLTVECAEVLFWSVVKTNQSIHLESGVKNFKIQVMEQKKVASVLRAFDDRFELKIQCGR